MKRLVALGMVFATPALAHPGHPVATGALGHTLAHLMIASTVLAALAIGAVLLTHRRIPAKSAAKSAAKSRK